MNNTLKSIIGALAGILITVGAWFCHTVYDDIQLGKSEMNTAKLAIRELQIRAEYTNGKLPAAPITTKIVAEPGATVSLPQITPAPEKQP